jgi:hypothetical protein
MHIDRAMDVENRRRMGNFALGNANRNDDAAVFHGLTVDTRLVFMDVRSEQSMPQASFFHARRHAGSASPEAGRVEVADVGFSEPSGLESDYLLSLVDALSTDSLAP